MKIVFRVDASLQIGTGHVMRCLTLADALTAQGADCHFISRAHAGHMLETIRQRGFALSVLPVEFAQSIKSIGDQPASEQDSVEPAHAAWLSCSWQVDARQSLVILKQIQPNWLVVDHYALDARWEKALQPCYSKLMVIDDLADRPHVCDLLLDQTFGRSVDYYTRWVPAVSTVLCGSHYALLRPEFAALRQYSLQRRENQQNESQQLEHLLITMGGVDRDNSTGKVLAALKYCELPPECRITVVMGASAPWLVEVRQQAAQLPWQVAVRVDISDMAQVMADSDLAIGAAGSTSWERCCLGLPTVMIVLADNQRVIAEAIQNAGAAKIVDITTDNKLLQTMFFDLLANKNLLIIMQAAAIHVADGLGAVRVTSQFFR